MMHGIDIASWQTGIDLSKVPGDFVIAKATGGYGYKNPDFQRQIEQAISAGKCVGAYHFAWDEGYTGATPEKEAQWFLNVVQPYLGKIVLALDWEAEAKKLGPAWAKRWLDYVKNKTGVTPVFYSYQSEASQKKWADVAKVYPLWMAQYAISTDPSYNKGYTPVRGYLADPPGAKTCGKWGKNITIRQYTSMGYLEGWTSRLDLNLAYMDRADWDKLCGKTIEPEKPTAKPTVDELAQQVLDRKWGNGTERKRRLEAAGYNYEEIQKRVNELVAKMSTGEPTTPPTTEELTAAEIDALANAVIRGDYGNGTTRKRKLGSKYEAVQRRVNKIDAERRKGR